jgi:predicted transcriptional regulator
VSASTVSYRDRIHIIQDIIVNLVEYGELNRTNLVRFCGLNLKKHRCVLDELQTNDLICVIESSVGKRKISTYKPTQNGIEFCRTILEPYEKMFPRTRCLIIASNNEYINNKRNENKQDSSSGIDISKSLIESDLVMQ